MSLSKKYLETIAKVNTELIIKTKTKKNKIKRTKFLHVSVSHNTNKKGHWNLIKYSFQKTFGVASFIIHNISTNFIS